MNALAKNHITWVARKNINENINSYLKFSHFAPQHLSKSDIRMTKYLIAVGVAAIIALMIHRFFKSLEKDMEGY